MRKINYKKDEILEVGWQDTGTLSGWRSEEVIKKTEPINCSSIGYFCKQNKNCISIAKTIINDPDDNDGLDVQTIPIGCIKKIRRLGGR